MILHPPILPRCVTVDVVLVGKLDSRRVRSGDSFTFKTVGAVPASGSMPAIPEGTKGFGVVFFARHAGSGGQSGQLVIEPRFVRLADGQHVPALADPALDDGMVAGATRNAPDLGIVPLLGVVVGGYNALHRGREIALEPGTPLRVVLGDDLAEHRCVDPPASDTDGS